MRVIRGRLGSFVLAAAAAQLVACGVIFEGDGDGPPEPDVDRLTPELPLPVGTGRRFVIEAAYGGRPVAQRFVHTQPLVGVADPLFPMENEYEDPDNVAFTALVMESCGRQLGPRFDAVAPHVACATNLALQHQYLCAGHTLLAMADSPLPWVLDTSVPFEPGDPASAVPSIEVRQRTLADESEADSAPPTILVPPQSSSGAATLALQASEYFRMAMVASGYLVSTCEEGSMALEVPTSRRDGEPGLSPTETVPVATVAVVGAADGLEGLRDATDVARGRILATAADRRARERDGARATVLSWRALWDSRLEVANRLVGVAPRMFEPDSSLIVPLEGDPDIGPVPAFGDYPVVTAVMEGEAEERAEALLRGARIDPRVEDPAGTLQSALHEDDPSAFPDTSVMGTDEFLAAVRTNRAAVVRAAARIVQEAAVSGHVILPESDVIGADVPPVAVPRVTGTRRVDHTPDHAYLYALTAGGVRIDQAIVRGTTPEPLGTSGPSLEYAIRSFYGSLDFAATGLGRALDRTDVQTLSAERRTELHRALATLLSDVRTDVPMRAQLLLEGTFAARNPISRVTLAVYGVTTEWETGQPAPLELVLGEEGLECATTGTVGHVRCDADGYRLTGTSFELRTDGADSGLGDRYARLVWNGAAVPAVVARDGYTGSGLPAEGRIYLLHRRPDGTREAWAGFDIRPAFGASPGATTWTRETQYAIGPTVLRAVGEILDPSASDASRPVNICDGIRSDLALPLEDELTEATTSRDDIESSFAGYLGAARQAAETADTLGDELLAAGLQMDLRAETARDELESVCGGTFNVPDISAAGPACSEASSCPAGSSCLGGTCVAGGVESVLPAGAGLEPLLRCLGDRSEDLVAVSLGQAPLCVFQYDGLALCECRPGDECPACPQVSATCDDSTGPYGALISIGYRAIETKPLELATGALRSFSGTPSNCYALARLRSRVWEDGTIRGGLGDEDGALLSEVLGAPWLDYESVRGLMDSLSFEMEPFAYRTVMRSGRAWLSEGSVSSGPNDEFPCAPLANPETDTSFGELYEQIGCGAPGAPAAGRSILCGLDCALPDATYDRIGRQARPLWEDADDTLPFWASRRPSSIRVDQALGRLEYWLSSEDDPSEVYNLWPRCRASRTTGDIFAPRSTYAFVNAVGRPSVSERGAATDVLATYALIANSGVLPEDASSTFSCIETTDTPIHVPGFGVSGVGVCPDVVARTCDVANLGATLHGDASASASAAALAAWSPGSSDPGSVAQVLAATYDGVADPRRAQQLDALELLCHASVAPGGLLGCPPRPAEPPVIRNAEEFARYERHLDCFASEISAGAASLVFQDVPADIAEDVRTASISRTMGRYEGSYGRAIAELRTQFETVNRALSHASRATSEFAFALRRARANLETADLQETLEDVQLESTLSSFNYQCLAAAMPTVSVNWGTNSGTSVSVNTGALFTCLDLSERAGAERRLAALRDSEADVARRAFLDDLARAYVDNADALAESARMLIDANAAITVSLNQLRGLRREARRSLAQTLLLEEDSVGREYAVTRAYRARYDSLRVRYERARHDAIRTAWLARLAIEQRLAVDLDEMTAEMTLVPPPATWADSVCSVTGVDYGTVRTGATRDYADQYIGDYVDLLEKFVRSYRIDRPFQDGADTAVISFKSDLVSATETCVVEGYNLLRWSVDPSSARGAADWRAVCASESGRCAVTTRLNDSPFMLSNALETALGTGEGAGRALGEVTGVAVQVGCASSEMGGTGACPSLANEGAGIAQTLRGLEPGVYVLSWYEALETPLAASPTCGAMPVGQHPRLVAAVHGSDPESVVTLRDMLDLEYATEFMSGDEDLAVDACRWRRTFVEIRNPVRQDVRVQLVLRDAAATADSAVFAAPQFEESRAALRPGLGVAPRPFFATSEDLTGPVEGCEDLDGSEFRSSRYWTYRCESLCADGPSSDCDDEGAGRRCFWEAPFSLDLGAIERGELIRSGGIAVGNYNYRIGRLAVNLVGEGVRDCSGLPDASSCYASGYIPFTLIHEGPYRSRAHDGSTVRSAIPVGRIQYAKALTAERYLTVPVSGADRALLTDHWRDEFRGRPLDGVFRLRIYDVPGLRWDRVEDIQLALDYTYWTRQE